MDRIFSKPFVDALEGHIDAVEVLAKQAGSKSTVASGSWDGAVYVHNLSQQTHLDQLPQAHKGKVTGPCFTDESRLLSCGVEQNRNLWKIGCSIDHQRSLFLFATASTLVQIWDETKSAPISNVTFPTSSETIYSVCFNQSKTSILASVGPDRTFTLYHIQTGKAERQVVMQMRANALLWSPTFPTSILLASEDHKLYTFNIRHLDLPSMIYKGHVAAVMSCKWSPTGTKFVSGGWDRTVRMWQTEQGHAPEVYHTKRMQRVLSTLFTNDARFVLSSSDDGNVCIWKGKASEKLGIVTAREHTAIEYRSSLVDWWTKKKRDLPKPPSATLETISEKDTPPNTPIRPGQHVTVQFDSVSGKAPTLQIRFSALNMPSPVEIAKSIKYGRDQPGIAHSQKSSYYANSVMTRQTEPPLSSPSVGLLPQNFADASPTRIKHTSDPLAWQC
ncbi:hypothetical protein D9757_014889 [Collybiopsis confluens]|uniref:Uncharacterized protein n=1 Tax=Collybiopsis confluens TaxID=2823264 RepID=A0A8H5CRQ1_9AGAR|nr:hypothetical protein D9757_014889 [Collybiopsis confluens]